MPVIALLAPAIALHRHRLVRRRGDTVVVGRPSRRRRGRVVELSSVIDVPFGRLREVAELLGGAAGELAEALALDLGVVGIIDGEEPVLTTLRPRQGDVAERLVRDLLAGESHRRPNLWLALRPGAYLAEAVDPWQPFQLPADRTPAALERETLVRGGVLVNRRDGRSSCRIELRCFGPAAFLGTLVRISRPWLGALREG